MLKGKSQRIVIEYPPNGGYSNCLTGVMIQDLESQYQHDESRDPTSLRIDCH
jgi:hypothetical protein